MAWCVLTGDCLELLPVLKPESIDAVITDPPYALSFMGKDWDSFGGGKGFQAWCEDWTRECLRVLKPGGYLLAFGGTRTYHREACAIEDAGFEIRDSLHWIYGSGFPKSLNVSKAIDKATGAEREVIGHGRSGGNRQAMNDAPGNGRAKDYLAGPYNITAPATDAAKQWEGWGTALKPSHEPIVVARKPLEKKTVAANVLEYGTGALNIDGCRIEHGDGVDLSRKQNQHADTAGMNGIGESGFKADHTQPLYSPGGRWPPNVILSDEAAEEMDRQSGTSKSTSQPRHNTAEAQNKTTSMGGTNADWTTGGYDDEGGSSRFFPCFRYQAKASKKERPVVEGIPAHPTVKPAELIRWLVKLVTPPGGCVLDPFGGTGTTAEACELEGFDCILIERDSDYVRLIESRMGKYKAAA